MSEESITVRKWATFATVSDEQLAEARSLQAAIARALDPTTTKPPPPADPGPNPDCLRLVAAAADNPLALDLLSLHAPEWTGYGSSYQCSGDHNGDDYEYWPCATVGLVANRLGVEIGGP